jgi:hypothetical protein
MKCHIWKYEGWYGFIVVFNYRQFKKVLLLISVSPQFPIVVEVDGNTIVRIRPMGVGS